MNWPQLPRRHIRSLSPGKPDHETGMRSENKHAQFFSIRLFIFCLSVIFIIPSPIDGASGSYREIWS